MPSLLNRELIKTCEEIIDRRVDELGLNNKENSFVIYPNGSVGKLVREYLEISGANVPYSIDNRNNNGVDVLNMADAVKAMTDNTYILVCLLNSDVYDEICEPLYNNFSKDIIIDLLYEEREKNSKTYHVAEEELVEVISSLDNYFGIGGRFVSPKICEINKRIATDLRSGIIIGVNNIHPEYSLYRRKAYSLAAFWKMKNIDVSDSDMLVGNIEKNNYVDMSPDQYEEVDTYGAYTEIKLAYKIGLFTRAPGAHCIPNYKELINHGVQYLIEKVEGYYTKTDDFVKKDFYESELILMYEFQKLILRYAEKSRKKENYDIANVLEKIAYKKPEHFVEVVQLIVLAHEAVLDERGSGSISFGRLDQYLYPFYYKDINDGLINNEYVQKIINELWRKVAHYEMGWQNITLGGGDINGNDVSNELTLMCLNASIITEGDQPQVSLRIPMKGLKQEVWDKAFDLVQTGKGFPEIYNDNLAIKAKEYTGVSKEDASDYGIVGCVEISVGGKEYSHTEAARINLMKLLELILNQGKCMLSSVEWELKEQHNLDDFKTYKEFEKWVKSEYVYFINNICDLTDLYNKEYANYYPVPFTSILMNGCIENAKDVTDCGSVYNNLTLDCVGIASVANALEAIENIVFEDKMLSLKELVQVLKNNFENADDICKSLQNYPKYGNDIDSVDDKLKGIVDLVTDVLDKKRIKYRNGKWQAGFYTSYFHATMGETTGASADGRRAKEALSSSLSPMAGTDVNGALAVLNSANKVDMSRFGNGMVLDLKFLPHFWEKCENREAVQRMIKTYFDRGGMEIQFNVVDRETLIEAKKNPVKYKDLVVRVSGFSAYFIALEENLQDEIIRRTAQAG